MWYNGVEIERGGKNSANRLKPSRKTSYSRDVICHYSVMGRLFFIVFVYHLINVPGDEIDNDFASSGFEEALAVLHIKNLSK